MNQVATTFADDASKTQARSARAGLMETLWAWHWWVICSVIVCTMTATALALFATPVYRASTLLAPTAAGRSGTMSGALDQLGGIASMVGLNLKSGDTDTQEAIAVLQSQGFTVAFIEDNHLMPELFAKRWNSKSMHWKGPPDKWPTQNKAYKLFNDKIREVSVDTHTGFVTLSVEWSNRVEAADWVNKLVERLNATMRERAIAQANSDIEYLERQLQDTKYVEVRNAINSLIEEEVRQQMIASATPQYSFQVIDRAVPADSDNPYRPRKGLMILVGVMVGLFVPLLIALLVTSRVEPDESAP